MNLPVALTCGDPNGIGIDISFEAKKELKNKIPFFLIADINHLKNRNHSQSFKKIQHPKECFNISKDILPVLHHEFPEIPTLNGSQPVMHWPQLKLLSALLIYSKIMKFMQFAPTQLIKRF